MNESASETPLKWIGFRVADILLHELEPDRFTLFVSHHYFAVSCVEFRISSTSLQIKDSEIEVSGEWKTEFIATPCIDSEIFNFAHRGGIQAGGRMLMDGPDHLLLVTGDQAYFEWYQEEHPLEPPPAGEHNIGPYLDGVIGRQAGEVAGFNATAALTALEIVWTQENLAEFIVNPGQFAPGTTMAGVGVSEEEAQLIVEFLAADQWWERLRADFFGANSAG